LKKLIIILSIIALSTGCAKKTLFKSDKKSLEDIKSISAGLNSPNWLDRLNIVKNISKNISSEENDSDMADEVILNFLIKATFDSHETVIIEAIKGLSILKFPEAMERLSLLSQDVKNSNTRWYAIQALALFKKTSNSPIFINGLKSEDFLIREASIKGLLHLDMVLNDEYIPAIISAINDQNESVKTAALQNLKIKDEKLYETIRKVFMDKKNESHVNLIKSTLIALEGYTLDEKAKEKTIELLTDRNPEIRILALRVLKKDNELRKFSNYGNKEMIKELLNKK
jgi:HEAT repeat protein